MTTVSFIILNYNTHALTARCIASIRQHIPAGSYEIIVVDNNSRADEQETLLQVLPPEVKIMKSRMNTGFGAGNMLGANEAQGDYLCFLNSDVFLTEDCVTPLCNYLQRHPETGVITPQQYNGENRLVPSFNHAPGLRHELLGKKLLERLFPTRYPPRKHRRYTEPFAVTQINGCFMLFPTEKFWQCGGFDLNIFLYYEEYDICTRLARKGWNSIVFPQRRFSHLHEQTTQSARSATRRELYLSKMYCYRKHHGWVAAELYRAVNVIKLLFKPRRWYILPVVLRAEALSQSLRHRISGT